MDPYVYDFVSPEVDALTHNLTYDKQDWSVYEYDGPFDYNGGNNVYDLPAKKQAAVQHRRKHHKKDIAERKMDEEVHGFAADNVPGIPWDRNPVSYGYNGNLNKYDSLHQHKHKHRAHQKWVAERNMDPYVYDFVGPEVDALTHNLTYEKKDWSVYEYDGPFDYNGGYNVWP